MTLEPVPSLRRLRAFEAVAQTSSLSAAAQSLRLTQPALTHSIGQLETELGLRLFDRKPDGSFLTGAGQIFQRRCQRFFDQMKEAIHQATALPQDQAQSLAQRLGSAQVRSLLAIWRTGSFRAAAQALGIADPSLQRPARDLEKVLGISLFRRAAAGWTVTETGGELARRLLLAINEIRSGAQEAGSLSDNRPHLRIGVLALSPRILLTQASAFLLARYPRYRIEIVEGPYARLAHDLNDGSLDILLGALRSPPPFADLYEEIFFEDPYQLACRKDHPIAQRRSITSDDLRQYEWIFPTLGLPRRDVLDRLISLWNLPAQVQFETNCLTTITALLADSDRLSILSRGHIAMNPALAGIDLALPHPPRHVGLTLRRNWLPTDVQAEFLAELRQAALSLSIRPQKAALGSSHKRGGNS